jgi:uncharacterized repeat protein (TIGR02543 family)
MRSIAISLALSFLASHLAAAAEMIVIDEPDATFKGNWQSIKEKAGFGTSPSFRYAMATTAAQATASAVFRPVIPVTGRYHVEIASSPGNNRCHKVPCVISGSEGEKRVVLNQQVPSGWHRVADAVLFSAGSAGYVEIFNNAEDAGTNRIVMADGARFIPTEDQGGLSLITTVTGNGKVVVSPKKSSFAPGSEVELTAEAGEGYIFGGWSGDASGVSNPLQITMTKAQQVTANFVEGNPGVIMESAECETEGEWQKAKPQWGARTNYQFVSTCAAGGTSTIPKATATYRPYLRKSGLYDVYIWYAKGPNRADNAPWEISGKDKKITVSVKQKINGGDWFRIATAVPFAMGADSYVRLSNETGASGSVVVADSVAFVYVGQP